MKKNYMMLAAVAALTMSVHAQNVGWIEVGDYYNPTEFYNGSYFDMAPTNFYLAHTGAQMIYTPDLLTGMEGREGFEIKYLNFKFNSESFEEIVRNAKVYLREIDETEFAVVEGVKQFFDFGELVAQGRYDFELLDFYGEDQVLAIEIQEPFTFSLGKSLLVTIVLDAEDDDNCTMGSDYAPFYTSGILGKAMTYTDNWTSFVDYAMGEDFPDATAMLGCGTNVELPVTEIGYTYEKMRGDVNNNGVIEMDDLTALINYLLTGDTTDISMVNAAACDGNEDIAMDDLTALINYLLNSAW